MRWQDVGKLDCTIARALSVVGDRWTLLILRDAFLGQRRFEGFQASLGVSRHRLADRLAKLVKHGGPAQPRNVRDWRFHRLSDAGWIMSLMVRDMNRDGRPDVLLSDRRGKLSGVRWLEMFARFGVPEYWIVDPRARRIEVCRLERRSYTLLADVSGEGVIESPTIAGLAFSVAGLFPSE